MYFPLSNAYGPSTSTKWTIGGEIPKAVPAGRYVLVVSGNGLSYDAAVFQR